MSSLQEKLQKQFTDKVKMEFRKFCLLLQAYSDTNSWVYECDFILTDEINWDRLTFYGGGQSVDMEGLVKSFFEYVIKSDINTDELWGHIDEMHEDNLTETGWLHFTIFPTQNKLQIEMEYDYYDNMGTTYEEYISDVVDNYAKQDEKEVQDQLERWEEQGAIFKVSYEGSNWNDYIDDSCTSNIAFTNTTVEPDNLDAFYNQQNYANDYFEISTFRGGSQVPNALDPQTYNGDLMINAYEKGYHLEESGGSGWIIVDFKEGTILMEHTEYNKSSYEVELAELNF